MSLCESFTNFFQVFWASMSRPTFESLRWILIGWLFASHHTISSILMATEALQFKHYSSFYRVFSKAKWKPDEIGFALFERTLRYCSPTIFLTLDDTLARKCGRRKLFGAGMHRDPLLSSKKKSVSSWGHCWLVLCVAVRLPFAPHRWFSLPILSRLYLTPKTAKRWKVLHRTRPQLAVELLKTLCKKFPHLHFHVLNDSTYGNETVLRGLPKNCDQTSRLPMNARIHASIPPNAPPVLGKPRKRGERLPKPAQVLQAEGRTTHVDLYARKNDQVRLAGYQGRWFKVPERKLNIAVVDPQKPTQPSQAFYSTCLESAPKQILEHYSGRWSIEETNKGCKGPLGFEEPQSWSRKAVERLAPIALLLYSMIVLWFADEGHRFVRFPERPWFERKLEPSFEDMLNTLRHQSLQHFIDQHPQHRRLLHELFRSLRPFGFVPSQPIRAP